MSKLSSASGVSKPNENQKNINKTDKSGSDNSNKLSSDIKEKAISLFLYDKDIPIHIKETLNTMDENQVKLKELIGKGIKIKKFVEFEAKVEETMGVEIDPIIEFFGSKYATTKDKFVLKFDDFIDLTQKWADSFMLKQEDEHEKKVEADPLLSEKLDMQTKSRDTLMTKLDIHGEKIREIFENFAENNDESGSSKQESVLEIKLKNIPKILDDIAYLTGAVLMTYGEFLINPKQKRSSIKAKEELVHYLWKRIHQEEVNELRRTRKNTSIYKKGMTDNSKILKEKDQQEDDKKSIEKQKKKKVVKKIRVKVAKKEGEGEGEESEEIEIEESEEEDNTNFDSYKGK
jgi:hypothetical protein